MGLITSLSWIVGIALTITAVPVALVRLIYSKRIHHWKLTYTVKERKIWYFHWLLTSDCNAKEIKLFDIGYLFMKKYHNLSKELRNERFSLKFKSFATELLAHIVGVVAIFGSLVFIAQRAFQGNMTVGDTVMYFGSLQQSQSSLFALLKSFAYLYEDNLFLTTLYEFLDFKPTLKELPNPLPVPEVITEWISFESVGFCYPGQEIKILENINLHISSGQTIAFVGENGSGKTTLIKLLCRLYDPTEWRITFDGIDIRDFKISDLQKKISIVFQDYIHYNLTIRENIWHYCVHCIG